PTLTWTFSTRHRNRGRIDVTRSARGAPLPPIISIYRWVCVSPAILPFRKEAGSAGCVAGVGVVPGDAAPVGNTGVPRWMTAWQETHLSSDRPGGAGPPAGSPAPPGTPAPPAALPTAGPAWTSPVSPLACEATQYQRPLRLT